MGTTFKRNKKWQVGLWDKAAKKRVYRTLPESVKSRSEAQRICAELQAKLDRKNLGLETDSSQTSGNGWLDVAADILNEVERECSKDWLSNCQSFVKRFCASVGDCPVAQVTTQQCRRYLKALNFNAILCTPIKPNEHHLYCYRAARFLCLMLTSGRILSSLNRSPS